MQLGEVSKRHSLPDLEETKSKRLKAEDRERYIAQLEHTILTLKKDLKRQDLGSKVNKHTAPLMGIPNYLPKFGKIVNCLPNGQIYVGSSSVDIFLSHVNNLVSENEDNLNDIQVELNPYHLNLKVVTTNNVDFTLPSYSYCLLLVDTFIQYNDGCYYFFNEGLVKENLKRIFNNEADLMFDFGSDLNESPKQSKTLQSIWYCKILFILAIGEMYLCTSNESSILPGSELFEMGQSLFQSIYTNVENYTKEGSIEVLLLYGFYLQVADLTIQSYYYLHLALETCILLGYHVDSLQRQNGVSSNYPATNRFQIEHKRRLFWTVYMYERMISLKQGLPLTISDLDVFCPMPQDFDMTTNFKNCTNYIFPESEFLINCIEITKINSVIIRTLEDVPYEDQLLSIEKLIKKLFKWKNSLPNDLFIDFATNDLVTSRLNVNLMTEYLHGFNLAVRPILFNLVIHNIQIGNLNKGDYLNLSNFPNLIVALLTSSYQASINTIRSLWSLLPENLVAYFGFMEREYLLNSTIAIILFNATFGLQDSSLVYLNKSFSIFKKMVKFGNLTAKKNLDQIDTLLKNIDVNNTMSVNNTETAGSSEATTTVTESSSSVAASSANDNLVLTKDALDHNNNANKLGNNNHQHETPTINSATPMVEDFHQIDLENINLSESDLDLWVHLSNQGDNWLTDLNSIEFILNNGG